MAQPVRRPGVRRRGRAPGRRRGAQPSCSPRWHRRKTDDLHGAGRRRARCPPGRGSRRVDRGGARRRLGGSRSPRPRPRQSVRAVLEHAVGAETGRARSRSSPATSCRRKKPDPAIYLLAVRRARRSTRPTRSWSRTPATGCWRRPAPACRCARHGQRLHRGRGLRRGGARGLRARRPGPSRRSRCSPTAASAAPGDFVTLDDLAACLDARRRARTAIRQRRSRVSTERAGASSSSSARSRRPRSTTRSTSATSTRWSATATSATRWPAASRSVLEGWDDLDRTDVGTFLKKVGDDHHLAGSAARPARSGARRSCGPACHGSATSELDGDAGRRHAAGRDRRHQGPRPVRRRRQDPARRAGPDDRRDRAAARRPAPTRRPHSPRPRHAPARRPRRPRT